MKKTIISLLVFLPLSAGAETVYVQSAKAKLLSKPHFNAEVVAEVVKGKPLDLIESQDRWLHVKTGTHTGWVSKFLVSDHMPVNKITILEGDETIDTNVRRRASVVTTAGAARGLAGEDRQRASQAGLTNYVALRRMEALKIGEQEAMAFLSEAIK